MKYGGVVPSVPKELVARVAENASYTLPTASFTRAARMIVVNVKQPPTLRVGVRRWLSARLVPAGVVLPLEEIEVPGEREVVLLQ